MNGIYIDLDGAKKERGEALLKSDRTILPSKMINGSKRKRRERDPRLTPLIDKRLIFLLEEFKSFKSLLNLQRLSGNLSLPFAKVVSLSSKPHPQFSEYFGFFEPFLLLMADR